MRRFVLLTVMFILTVFAVVPAIAQEDGSYLKRIGSIPNESVTYIPEIDSAKVWFSPDGSIMTTVSLLSGTTSRTVLYDTDTGENLAGIVFPAEVFSVGFSQDGTLFGLAAGYYSVYVFDLATLLDMRTISLETLDAEDLQGDLVVQVVTGDDMQGVNWMGFNSDNSSLATLDSDDMLFWDLTHEQDIYEAVMNGEELSGVEIGNENELAVETTKPASIGPGDLVHSFSRINRNTVVLNSFSIIPGEVAALTSTGEEIPNEGYNRMSNDGTATIYSNRDGIWRINPMTGEQTGGIDFSTLDVPILTSFVDLSSDGQMLVTADRGLLRIWDLNTGEMIDSALMVDDAPRAVIWSDDSSRLAVVFRSVIVMWEYTPPEAE